PVVAADRTVAAVEPVIAADRTVAAVEPALAATAGIVRPVIAAVDRAVAAIEPTVLAAAAVTAAAVTEVVTKPATEKQDAAPPTVPTDKLVAMATVRRGEGPFQSAERILKSDGKKHSIDEVMALTRALQRNFAPERNNNKDMKGLKVNYQFITKDNFAAIIADVKNPQVQAQLRALAMAS
ncbi:MAG: hypothetical protein JST89_05120, partial [Cyanobacteria bacterium SZAS-4]|nr:hypothetical protein [Cyanobacteria bacterium SZAS-4]